jgi:UDP-glucose 4-epimerase
MASVVLVTGVSRYLGSRLAGRLSADPSIGRVIGVDTVPPSRADLDLLGRTEFVRADIRNPLIGKVISQAGVDTVVHASVTATPHGAGGRTPMKEMNVIGTMQLLAACQKSESVQRLVVKSTTAVYGTSSRDPAIFTEDMPAKALPASGYAKDAVEVEGYVRGFVRRRPDVDVTLLRFANFVGPFIDTPLTRYFQLPVVPTAFGFDPRLQLLHESDAIEILRLAVTGSRPGTFNAAGDGALLLSQAIRRAGRISLPVPAAAVSFVGRAVRRSGMVDFSPEQMQFLNFGRVVCNARLKDEFGYQPAYSTAEAFDSFVSGRPVQPVVSPRLIEAGESAIAGLLGLHPEPMTTTRVVRHG